MSADEGLIDRFCDQLWLEDGLSQNTLSAYRRDLAGFSAWLKEARSRELNQAESADIDAYLAHRFATRAKPRTAAGASTSTPPAARKRSTGSASTGGSKTTTARRAPAKKSAA